MLLKAKQKRTNMKSSKLIWSSLICALMFTALIPLAYANDSVDPEGLWLASKKQDLVVKIEHCDEGLCGKIFWSSDQDQSICAKPVLWGFTKNEDNTWSGGTIHKVDTDMYYSAHLDFIDNKTLNLTGYLGLPIFGKSYDFERVSAKHYSDCLTNHQALNASN